MRCDPDLLEKHFVQLISAFRAKNGKFSSRSMLQKIESSKLSANGPLQFMKKYIEKKEKYPKEIKLACLQWAQTCLQYAQACRIRCGDVLTSGDILVILPGEHTMNMFCMYPR